MPSPRLPSCARSRSRMSGTMRSTARSRRCTWLSAACSSEAPHQGLALVGHLCAVDGDAAHDDADGLAECLDGVVLVPNDAAVALAALRALAPKVARFSQTVAVAEAVAVSLLMSSMTLSFSVSSSEAVCPVVISLWDTRAQRNHLALEGLGRELVRKVADVGAEVGVLSSCVRGPRFSRPGWSRRILLKMFAELAWFSMPFR